jgi:hypothetical protein
MRWPLLNTLLSVAAAKTCLLLLLLLSWLGLVSTFAAAGTTQLACVPHYSNGCWQMHV